MIRYDLDPATGGRWFPTEHYKFQALVKPSGEGADIPVTTYAAARRMVLCAEKSPDHGGQIFRALVSGDGSTIGSYTIVTLRVAGDDVRDYLGIGERFRLWLGSDVAEGVITRRLFV